MRNIHFYFFLIFTTGFSISCASQKNNTASIEIGICTNFSNAAIMLPLGYTYVEEGVRRFLVPADTEEKFNNLLEEATHSPLPVKACNSFIPGDLKSVGTEAVHSEILTFAETAFRRARKAGVEIIVFGSGGSRSIPDGFSRDEALRQFIDLSRKMASIAAKYKITVVLEPLNASECNFINSVAEGGEIVRQINHPNFQLLADIFHMSVENESPENIVTYGKLIKHVHIAEKQDRAVPGTHEQDFSPYFHALRKINYKGRISIEARWNDMETQAPKAIETIRKQLKNR